MKTVKYRAGAITRKPNSTVDAGVLEVKMRSRLKDQDPTAVPVGCVSKLPTAKKSSQKNHPSQRKPTFAMERTGVMNTLSLSAPVRHVVDMHVTSVKRQEAREKSSMPPVSGAFKKRNVGTSAFPVAYSRGQIPALIEHKTGGNALRWTQDINDLDYSFLLPLFFEGIRETQDPYQFLAHQGVDSLLDHGKQHPEKVHRCLHKIVQPIRTALNTRDPRMISECLKLIQRLLSIDGIGVALLPYYRQILPVLNIFKTHRHNIGDQIDYSQRNGGDLGNVIQRTLEMMEETGGDNAYVNLKYLIPTYEGIHLVTNTTTASKLML